MKRLLKKADARKLLNIGINLDPMLAEQAIKNSASISGFNGLIQYEGSSYSALGMVSEDFQYVFEAYLYNGKNTSRWGAIIIAPVEKIKNNSISSSDLSVHVFEIKGSFGTSIIMEQLGRATAKDGTTPKFSEQATTNFVQQNAG